LKWKEPVAEWKLAMNPIFEIAAKPDELTVDPVRLRQLSLLPPSRPLVERFGADFFRSLPECPAVYLMCGVQEGVLYVGKARNLRQRLAAYRSADTSKVSRKIRRLLASVNRIYWDPCADEGAALSREQELLRILRPRFNTVGKYPAPGHHVGWQRLESALLLGCGAAMEGWGHRFGEFRGIKPVWSALLRLIWRALHPSKEWQELPARLSGEKPPAVVRFGTTPGTGSAQLNDLTEWLESFWRGEAVDFPGWLLSFGAGRSRFEEAWRERDATILREFQERQFPLAVSLKSGRQSDEGETTSGSSEQSTSLPRWLRWLRRLRSEGEWE